jgi:hypothetical protein
MAGRPSPSLMRCHRADVGDLQSPRVKRARIRASNPKPDASHMDDIRATFSGRGKFQPSFFLPLFGPGKIPGEAFFCHCFGEPCRRGGCWGCATSTSACVGTLTGGRTRQRQRAMRVRGSAQGREMSLTRFVFFGYGLLESLPLCPIDCDGVSSRRVKALRFAASPRPPPWRRPSPR